MPHPNQKDITDNLNNWNDRAKVHANGGYGDLSAFVHDKQAVTPAVKRDFAEMINSLIAAGLTIKAVGEHKITDWQALPMLVYDQALAGWRLPDKAPQIPLTFSIVAQKQ
ncbi:hypothetical protein EQ500_01310 [Lactobacillus sp. XV13L]|nr:hypothetical protein [Lactobacillus sp. XV13L]